MAEVKTPTRRAIGDQPVASKGKQNSKTQDVSPILRNLTINEFKAELGVVEVQVVEGPNGRFLSSKGKSVGTVGTNTDLKEPLQVMIIDTEEGELAILCNQGTGGDYATVATL